MPTRLADVARRADQAVARARADLVAAVRNAAAQGMTQAAIAKEIRRSQPEVSRLLRFHGTTALGRRLRSRRSEVLRLIHDAGGRDVRVFGSVARGDDSETSDVDLLFVMTRPISLLALGDLERAVAEVIGNDVDLVPESSVLPVLRERIAGEAVPL